MSIKKIVYLDQVVGPISIDIINYFSERHEIIEVIYGNIQSASTDINSSVRITKLFKYLRSSTLKRVVSWVVFFIQSLFVLLTKRKNYILFAVSNPPLNIFTCYIFNRIFGIPYYILVFDMYPDVFVKYEYLSESNFIVCCWNKLNNIAYQRASKIFTLTSVMSEKIIKNGGLPEVVDMWANTENIIPIKKNENKFLIDNGLSDSFIVLYSGNFGETHDIESIIKAAEELRDYDRIKFVFIGDGYKRKLIENAINIIGLKNILIYPFQDRSMFPYSIASADISIVTLEDKASEISIPSKLFYNMAAGNAIISLAHADSELAKIAISNQLGINLTSEFKLELGKQIISLYENASELKLFSENSRKASALYSLKNVKKFELE